MKLPIMVRIAQQDPLVNAILLQKIDKLREKSIGKHVPLPQASSPPRDCAWTESTDLVTT